MAVACWLTGNIYGHYESGRWVITFGGHRAVRLRSSAIPIDYKEETHVEQTRHPNEGRRTKLQGLALVSRPRSTGRYPYRRQLRRWRGRRRGPGRLPLPAPGLRAR